MKKNLLLTLFAALPFTAWAGNDGDNDDFGAWMELSAKKDLPHDLSVGVEGELRMHDNSSTVDRWSLGANLGYKVNKYLKVGVGYQILDDYTSDKISKEERDVTTGELMAYRYTPSYWTPRHRFYTEAVGSIKLWKWLRISVRERYQFTHKTEKTITGRYDTEAPDWERDPVKDKFNECKSRQVLRSRIKLQLDKKHLDWSPFVAVEFHNNVAVGEYMSFDKLRTSVGTEYKINKQNDVSLSYVMTLDRTAHPYQTMHAICASYSYDF
ncbi:MAG: DUF2490 domain-containing protein [Bacteroidales bacterium]|nr:DUF2490 domain-containing protein [Bacteroidales bacterium]